MSAVTSLRTLRPWQPGMAPAAAAPSRLDQLAGEILDRCRGEGPANCVARCPLHVDAQRYVQLTRQGKFAEALQVVREKLPFPGVLGYVCAHPCELHCKRIDEDASIRIRDIKRFLAEQEPGEPQHLLECAPATGKRVAVVGAGPAGLLAAHDLRRRGHEVVVIEKADHIGGCLVDKIPAWRLPRTVIDRDLSVIAALGIKVELGREVGRDTTLAELRAAYDAVLLFAGFEGGQGLLAGDAGLERTVRGTVWADPTTGATALAGVFAGGDSVSGPATVVTAMAMGRRAAESADRYLVGRDVAAERESALPPELLWQLDVDEAERKRRERAPTMLVPCNEPMSAAEAIEEAGRCLDCTCGLCVKDCEFLTQYCASPKELARQIRAGVAPALKMVYSCNICSLCRQVCPVGLDTGEMLLAARRDAVEQGIGPLPQHKPIVSYFKAGISPTFTMSMSEPGTTRSKRLFFTGCALPAVSPRNTLRVYDELRRNYPGTGVLMFCCGAPAELIGMEGAFEETCAEIRRVAERLGAEELVAACPDCAHTLQAGLPELRISTVWELLGDTWTPPNSRDGATVAIHDSCKAHHMPETHAGIRKLIAAAGGVVDDVEYREEKARCCGSGGMIYPVDPDLSRKITDRRAAESAQPMVTYCAGCRMALASRGKEAVHILDFLLADDWRKAARAKPTGSISRYANRLRTKFAFRRLKPLAAGKGAGR